jgi:hypothetical protein
MGQRPIEGIESGVTSPEENQCVFPDFYPNQLKHSDALLPIALTKMPAKVIK